MSKHNCKNCTHKVVCALWEIQNELCDRECAYYQPTLTPPNEPLTIEQLREMDGEPAYLKVFDPLLESGWHVIKAVTEDKIVFRDLQPVYVPIKGMGTNYNLYLRPPERQEDV